MTASDSSSTRGPITVGDVADHLGVFAPLDLAESWDNVGLLVGDTAAPVSRILTCLTLTPDVAEEAIAADVDLIVTHHPVLFRGAKRLTTATAEGRMLLDLVRANVSVFSPHTAYDSATNGVNRQLANAFGLTSIKPIRSIERRDGDGSGRWGRLRKKTTLGEFVGRVKDALSLEHVQFVGDDDREVKTIAIACGAAGEYIDDALRLGCDVFVTGETRFHTCLQARTENIGLVLLGHYGSERPALESLAERLDKRFPDIDAFASRTERDPIRWA